MKDYKTLFKNANQTTFTTISDLDNRIAIKNNSMKWFFVIVGIACALLFSIIYFQWLRQRVDYDPSTVTAIAMIGGTFLAAMLSLIIYNIMYAWDQSLENRRKEQIILLKKKATEFATTIYYDDIIAALSSGFTLSSEFKEKFKNFINDLNWLETTEEEDEDNTYEDDDSDEEPDDENLDDENLLIICEFDPDGITCDYVEDEKEKFIIRHEGCIYYLTGWAYQVGFPFHFWFTRIQPNGQVEKWIEFELPVMK